MFINRMLSAILRPISQVGRTIRAPFAALNNFRMNNPVSRTTRVFKSQGQQIRSIGNVPGQVGRQLVPKRFRMAQRGEVADPADIPEEDKRRAGEFDRARKRKRIRGTARKATFTQIHMVDRATAERTILHIGSPTGVNFAEYIINPGTSRTIVLQFWMSDETLYGSPLTLRVASGPKDATISVDNQLAQPEVPVKSGSRMEINGRLYDITLFVTGDLPAVTRVDAVWETNIGPVRDINQDAIGIYQHPQGYMFTVADGVGGGYAGEEVSAFSVKYMLSVFKRNIAYTHFSWYDVYDKAFRYINAEVRNFAQTTPQATGTTLTSVFIRNWTAYVAHVGDSRLYHLRGNVLRQITNDHNRNVEMETRNRAGYAVKQTRTILSRAIGRNEQIDPEIQTLSLQPNDMLLLATDGVLKQIPDDELYEIMTTKRFTEIAAEMVERANSRNNTDNATVIAIDVMREAYDRDVWLADPDDRVFVGGPSWYLKLKNPTNLNTAYSLITRTGCLVIAIIIVALNAAWVGRQVQRFNTFLRERTALIDRSAANDSGVQFITQPAQEIQIFTIEPTVTEPAPATATITLVPTLTPRPTDPPTATLTSTVTPTPIPPTSTLRPG
ncbi:MAG: protein phosphatase 2C domain-containing protein [Chloroflexota bacterium]